MSARIPFADAGAELPPWVREVEDASNLKRLGKPENEGENWVHAHPEDRRIEIEYYADHQKKAMVGVAIFHERAVGHPGYAHGGAIMSAIDDLFGTTAWLTGEKVFSVNMNVDLRAHVHLGVPVRIDASVDRVEGRKVWVKGTVTTPPGKIHAEATGLFLKPRPPAE